MQQIFSLATLTKFYRLAFVIIIFSLFFYISPRLLSQGKQIVKDKNIFESPYLPLDRNKGFAYFPVNQTPKSDPTAFHNWSAVGTLEMMEKWKDENPNKIVVAITGDGLGQGGTNEGYFIAYTTIDK